MSYESLLCDKIAALDLQIEPELDTSASTEYVAYFYTSEGTLFGDDAPCLDHRSWTVVYVAPLGQNKIPTRMGIRQAIFDLFGAWPEEENASDANGQRWVYNFTTIGGIDDGTDGNLGN